MEKKYCKHCRTLTSLGDVCEKCGSQDFQAIIISVQALKQFKKEYMDERF